MSRRATIGVIAAIAVICAVITPTMPVSAGSSAASVASSSASSSAGPADVGVATQRSVLPRAVWGAPQQFTAQAGNRSALVRWRQPVIAGSTTIASYLVQRYDRAGRVWVNVAQTPPFTTEVLVEGLRNGSKQRFRVAAMSVLGVGEFAVTSVPLPSAISISAGDSHTCAVTPEGRVRCWGSNADGQLGSSVSMSTSEPVVVPGVRDVVTVAAGAGHTCALRRDGDVWCWGADQFADAVSGEPMSVPQPQQVMVGDGVALAGIVSISASGHHTCAVANFAGVWCWGRNSDGQLGHGSRSTFGAPRQVVGLPAMTAVAAGADATCALQQYGRPGALFCWGRNSDGVVASGNTVDAALPVRAGHVADAVSVGSRHACSVAARRVTCWGDNSTGQFGDGTVGGSLVGREVPQWSGVEQISTAEAATCAIRADASVWCSGDDGLGQLGDGNTHDGANVLRPVQVVALRARSIDMGRSHGCAIGLDGRPRCWGDDQYGQLGDGASGWFRNVPRVVKDF
jgi:hypothetical protein